MKLTSLVIFFLITLRFANAQQLKNTYFQQPDFLKFLLTETVKPKSITISNIGITEWYSQDMFHWNLISIYKDSLENGNYIQYISLGKRKWYVIEYFANEIIACGELISKNKTRLPNDTIRFSSAENFNKSTFFIYQWQKTNKNGNWFYISKDKGTVRRVELYKNGVLIATREERY